MCLYPKLARNKKYESNKKNGGVIPPISDPRVLYVPYGCGNCIECRKQKANHLRCRMLEDIKENKGGKFVCFTFSNEAIKELVGEIQDGKLSGYELDNEIAILAIRRFLAKHIKKYNKSIRHWLITELGHQGTENIHLHGIIWNTTPMKEIQKLWTYGKLWIGTWVNEQTVNYTVKYITKVDNHHKTYKSRILASKGIGSNYLKNSDSKRNKYSEEKTNEFYRTRQGTKIGLPTYYRNKIYTDEEKEKLWLKKLDKEERWICGERVDISQNEKQYYKLLEYHRQRNIELGYGTNAQNWKLKEYEQDRRKIMQDTRISKAKSKIK